MTSAAGLGANKFITGKKMTQTLTFDHAYQLTNLLIKKATKEQLAECARLLALNLAHYQIKQSEIPVNETLAILGSFERNEEHLHLLIEGMLNLVGVLVNVCGEAGHVTH